jgi:ATP/ADP translocase
MAKRRLFKILSAVVNIKPGEEVLATLLFFYFFLITAPFGIIKVIRTANYLEDLTAKKLPYAYITLILVGFAVSLHAKLQSKISRRSLLLSTLAFFVVTGLVFWGLFSVSHWKWLALIYYMWANIFVVALTTQFWFLVNDVFNPREAKRLIGFFGSGGLLGGIAGYLLTWFLAKSEQSHLLLLLSALFLCACMVVVNAIFAWLKKNESRFTAAGSASKPIGREAERVGLWDSFQSVRVNDYLKLMAAIVVVTWVVSTFIDWQSMSIIEQNRAAKANLASFFGQFYAGMLVFAFLLQFVLTSRFINRFGIRPGLMIYPLIILLCSVGIGAFPESLGVAIAIKGSDKALSYSINQSSRELLYIPVMPNLKYRAKIFIDMFLNRFSKAVGGVLLLGLFFIVGLKPIAAIGIEPMRWVSIVTGGFVLLWIVLNFKISGAYVREVKDQLAKKWERADGIVAGKMDVEAAKLVVDTLESRMQSPTLFALHLYELARQNKLTPEIRNLLGLKPSEISSPLSHPLFEYDASPWLPDFEERIPPAEMDKEIREILSLENYQKLMEDYAGKVLEDKSGGSETARMELAKAIGLMDGRSTLAARLEDLLLDASPKVFQYAAESAAKLKKKEYVPILIRKLGDQKAREDAKSALEKYGGSIAGTLSDFLSDAGEGLDVRRQAASLLAHIATRETADVLLEELARGREELNEEIIDALDRIRSQKPDIEFEEEVVRGGFASEIEKLGPAKSPSDLLPLFKLLGLVYNHEDIFRSYQNILKGTKDSIAYAVELLDHTVDLEIKERLFPILEGFSSKKSEVE